MQPDKRALELLDRYLAGECNEDERILVEQYYLHEFKSHMLPGKFSTGIGNEIWENLEKKIRTHRNTKSYKLWPMIRVAASIIFLLLSVYYLYRLSPSFKRSRVDETIYTTQYGEKKSIRLVDGTRVILNAGSKLILRNGFNDTKRDVYLEGEGHFEVVHNKNLPFTVVTTDLEVKDIGTVFNVRAYENDRHAEATLIEGAIEVQPKGNHKTLIKTRYQKLTIDKRKLKGISKSDTSTYTGQLYQIKTADENLATGGRFEDDWIKNRLSFNNELFTDIVPKIERWYNVKIRINNKQFSNYRFTSTFENENIDQVMQTLALTANFKFRREGREITIL